MLAGKITLSSSTSTTTLIQIVKVVSICCLTVLFEVMPMTNIATSLPAYSKNSIDNTAHILKTLTTATTGIVKSKEKNDHHHDHSISSAITANLLYQSQDYHEHNIGLIGMGTSTVNYNNPPRRDSRSNFRNDDGDYFESDLNNNNRKLANNITARNRSSRIGGRGSGKLVHSSFRLEEDVVKALTRVAEKRGLSLSSLVNKTLKNYVTSEMYFEELGFLLISKNFLRKTFEGLDQKHVEELGREYGLTMAKEYVSYFYPQVSSDTLIQFLEIWFRRFQSCQHRIEEGEEYERDGSGGDGVGGYSIDITNVRRTRRQRHYFTINHDINMNFSLALQSILGGLIEPIVRSTVEFTNLTSNAITFSFRVLMMIIE
jgi:hypothetical protein